MTLWCGGTRHCYLASLPVQNKTGICLRQFLINIPRCQSRRQRFALVQCTDVQKSRNLHEISILKALPTVLHRWPFLYRNRKCTIHAPFKVPKLAVIPLECEQKCLKWNLSIFVEQFPLLLVFGCWQYWLLESCRINFHLFSTKTLP